MKVSVKICCISSIEEAKLALRYGADAIGLVGRMPSGPGVIDDQLIKDIAASVPAETDTFLLTSETTAAAVIAHHQRANTKTIQLVDCLPRSEIRQIRKALPHLKLVQVVHVLGEESVYEAITIANEVDALLLDSGNPNLEVKMLGGTGYTHNWLISKRIVQAVDIPVYLAGGLHSGNVREAIYIVRPYGIDVCSGLRTNGQLDEKKLAAFFKAI